MIRAAAPKALVFFLAGALVLDRIAWAAVSQWREDQAVNLWLGYTQSPLQVPVGLVNSQGFANPNGLVLFSVLLSRLPNPLAISTFLGLLQAALLGWLCWVLTRKWSLFLLIAAPTLSAVTFRGTSVELYNNVMVNLPNLLFLVAIVLYVQRPTPWILPASVAVMLMSPSIYLGGLVNAAAYGLVLMLALRLKPPARDLRAWAAPALTAIGLIGLSLWLTWLPYIGAIESTRILQFQGYEALSPMDRLSAALRSIVKFPYWSLAQYGSSPPYAIFQFNRRILAPATMQGLRLIPLIALVQGIVCYAVVAGSLTPWLLRRRALAQSIVPGRETLAMALLLLGSFVIVSCALSPLLGGPVWAEGERRDHMIQFVPSLLIIWFLAPVTLRVPDPLRRTAEGVTHLAAFAYTILSLVAGVLVVWDTFWYRGKVLTAGDVPLFDKHRVVDFIARDWMARSASPEIPVSYDLGAGRWDWIPEYGEAFLEWYPAPYTMGRHFDYELWREYGLHNRQEGVQMRSLEIPGYLVTYAFRPAPAFEGYSSRERNFGRLRVTVIEE